VLGAVNAVIDDLMKVVHQVSGSKMLSIAAIAGAVILVLSMLVCIGVICRRGSKNKDRSSNNLADSSSSSSSSGNSGPYPSPSAPPPLLLP